MVELYDVIKQGYKKNPKLDGFILDKDLSNRNEQAYYNPTEKKYIYNVSGTKSLNDWGVNMFLGAGKLKSTKRYLDAHKGLRQFKEKYKVNNVVVSGDSLGGAIVKNIASKGDKVHTFNKASVIGSKSRSNQTDWRVSGDPISFLDKYRKNTKTLENTNYQTKIKPIDMYKAHLPSNLKGRNIKI